MGVQGVDDDNAVVARRDLAPLDQALPRVLGDDRDSDRSSASRPNAGRRRQTQDRLIGKLQLGEP